MPSIEWPWKLLKNNTATPVMFVHWWTVKVWIRYENLSYWSVSVLLKYWRVLHLVDNIKCFFLGIVFVQNHGLKVVSCFVEEIIMLVPVLQIWVVCFVFVLKLCKPWLFIDFNVEGFLRFWQTYFWGLLYLFIWDFSISIRVDRSGFLLVLSWMCCSKGLCPSDSFCLPALGVQWWQLASILGS
jgi:hypothetical protein